MYVVRRGIVPVPPPTNLNDDLVPLGLIPCDRERAVPFSPTVLGRCWAVAARELSNVVVMLTNYGGLRAQSAAGLGNRNGLRDGFNAGLPDLLFPAMIGGFRLLFVVGDR